jgi:hypothetical protein
MATIVEYTDAKAPENLYPERIISPTRSGPCCFTDMAAVGPAEQDGHWEYQYRRCRNCGFTVRVILRELPDEGLLRDLRWTLQRSFQRNVLDI